MWQALAILLVGVPLLLILAALVPLDFGFVPYDVAVAWHHRRHEVAFWAGSILLVEAVAYLLLFR